MKGISVVELLLTINFPFVSFFFLGYIQSLSILSSLRRSSAHFAAGVSICFTDLVHTNILCSLLRYSFFIGTLKPFSLRPSSQNFEIPLCHILPISAYTLICDMGRRRKTFDSGETKPGCIVVTLLF